MPLPKPQSGEKKSDFISRCMGDKETKKEFPKLDQRTAVCQSLWEKARRSWRKLKNKFLFK